MSGASSRFCGRFTISTMANDGKSPASEQNPEHPTRDILRLETHLAEAQKLSHTGSFGWKPGNRELVFSEETYRIYEFNPAEQVTLEKLIEQVHPDDRALVLENAYRTSSSPVAIDFTHRLLFADGRVKYLHVLATPMQSAEEEIEFAGAVVDITQAKESEKRIRRNEKELRAFIETMPAYAGTNLPDGSFGFISQNWLDYTGLSREQWMGWGWSSTIHPEDVDRVMCNWRAALNSEAPVEYELRCRSADGIYQWFLYRGSPLHDDEGSIAKWYWTLTNINALKDTESTLRTREHQLLNIIETIPSMFWSTGPAGEITHLNQKVLDYCGVTQEGYDERGWLGFLHPDDRDRSARIFSQAIETGEAYNITYRVQGADGEYRWQHSKAEPLRDPKGNIIEWYGLSVDIDEGKTSWKKRSGRESMNFEASSKLFLRCFGQHHPRERSPTLVNESSIIPAFLSRTFLMSVGRKSFTQMILKTPQRHSSMPSNLENRTLQLIVYDGATGNITGTTRAVSPCVILMEALFSGTGSRSTSMSKNELRTTSATRVSSSRRLRG